MKTPFCIVTTTTDSEKITDKIVKTLLEKKLAACIQTYNIQSNYRWKGKIESNLEILLQIKTKKSLFNTVKSEIEFLHNYDIPEILLIEISDANAIYLNWLKKETL